jgi:hypothetical protein
MGLELRRNRRVLSRPSHRRHNRNDDHSCRGDFLYFLKGAALRAARRPGRCRWPAFPLRASPSGPAAAAGRLPTGTTTGEDVEQSHA